MTSHELAKLLLAQPDIEVGFMEYMGGDDEFREVKDVKHTVDKFVGEYILLKTYKEVDPG